jgi:anti-anti-sigma regulatory factor
MFFATLRDKFASAIPIPNGNTYLGLAGRLHSQAHRGAHNVTYRIHRSATPDTVVFTLSGDLDIEHTSRLQEFLVKETDDHVTLDLREVTLVDRAAVRFLAEAEGTGIEIVNCPEYVRRWIAAERKWPHEHPEPGQLE